MVKKKTLQIINHGNIKNNITGEDVAGLLHEIHTHAELIPLKKEKDREEIYYREKDLLKILKALGLPEPIWGKSMTVKEYLKSKQVKPNRIEVIDWYGGRGRVFTHWEKDSEVKVDIQDNGRTVKIFISKKK